MRRSTRFVTHATQFKPSCEPSVLMILASKPRCNCLPLRLHLPSKPRCNGRPLLLHLPTKPQCKPRRCLPLLHHLLFKPRCCLLVLPILLRILLLLLLLLLDSAAGRGHRHHWCPLYPQWLRTRMRPRRERYHRRTGYVLILFFSVTCIVSIPIIIYRICTPRGLA
jgi:hypothetical protein